MAVIADLDTLRVCMLSKFGICNTSDRQVNMYAVHSIYMQQHCRAQACCLSLNSSLHMQVVLSLLETCPSEMTEAPWAGQSL